MRVATGRSMQLTKPVGEYRVAAELAGRDVIAATFSGSVPHYDEFFILDWETLTTTLTTNYRDYLAKHEGVRPKNPESFHTALEVSDLEVFRDSWETILDRIPEPAEL